MHENRIRNILLVIVAVLLLVNLGVRLSPAVHAIPAIQYKAVMVDLCCASSHAQQVLDQQSAQGWVFVGAAGTVLIFKK